MSEDEDHSRAELARALGWDPLSLENGRRESLDAVMAQLDASLTAAKDATKTAEKEAHVKALRRKVEDKIERAVQAAALAKEVSKGAVMKVKWGLEDLVLPSLDETPKTHHYKLSWGQAETHQNVYDDLLTTLRFLTANGPSAASSPLVQAVSGPNLGNLAVLSNETLAGPTATSAPAYRFLTPDRLNPETGALESIDLWEHLRVLNMFQHELPAGATEENTLPRTGETLIIPIALAPSIEPGIFRFVWRTENDPRLRSVAPEDLDKMSNALTVVATVCSKRASDLPHNGRHFEETYDNQSEVFKEYGSDYQGLANRLRLVQQLLLWNPSS